MQQPSCTISSFAGVAMAVALLASSCTFDRTPLRLASSRDAEADVRPVDPDAATRNADVVTAGASAISESGGAAAPRGGPAAPAADEDDAGAQACAPVNGAACCSMLHAATQSGGCMCSSDVDTDSDGVPDCIDPAPHGWMKQITLDGSQLDAALVNFPVLVRISDPRLSAASSGDDLDIHFLADDASTLLDYEIERYDAASGALVAWVRLPQLAADSDASFYVAYQDGQGDRSNAAGLWSDYEYVWHLSPDLTANGARQFKDSTAHADGTAQGDITSDNTIEGVAAAGFELDGVDDRIAFRNVYAGAGPMTIGAWVNMRDDTGDSGAIVIAFGREAQGRARFLMSQDSATGDATGAGFYSNDVSGPALPRARWSHLVWSWDGVQSSIYIDGRLAAGPTVHVGANTEGTDGAIGASIFSYPRFLKGQIDEVRVATTARSSAFIRAEYLNQRPDSTFIKSVGPEVPIP
jgi:hypothetical protein